MLILLAALAAEAATELPRSPVLQSGFSIRLSDYPREDYIVGHQGRVMIQIDVDVIGKPTGCTVLEKTPYPELNKQACRIAVARMHFTPALDNEGAPTTGMSKKAILWKINR